MPIEWAGKELVLDRDKEPCGSIFEKCGERSPIAFRMGWKDYWLNDTYTYCRESMNRYMSLKLLDYQRATHES